jgi:hypothetical protein
MQNASNRVAVVRAIPAQGHKRRWCGLERWVPDPKRRPQQELEQHGDGTITPKFDEAGNPVWAKHALPWPDTDIKVLIVDEPAPFDPEKNGGVPVEISPATLVMLEQDPRIAVKVIGGEGGDPAEVVRAKAQAAEAEKTVEQLKRELAEERERMKRYQLETSKQAQETGAKLTAAESELAALRSQVSRKK